MVGTRVQPQRFRVAIEVDTRIRTCTTPGPVAPVNGGQKPCML